MTQHNGATINLFYSYSHKDTEHRKAMMTALAPLLRENLIHQWSDEQIRPGQPISNAVKAKMDQADIIIYVFSPDFIESDACTKEWQYGKSLAASGKPLFRIPVITRHCAWQDVLGEEDLKALPVDGKPVSGYESKDVAWQEVYQGIKDVVEDWRQTFTARSEFIAEIGTTDFIATDKIELDELFTFLHLTADTEGVTEHDELLRRKNVYNKTELLDYERLLVHGPEKSGKSALGRHLCLSLINRAYPVLFVDLTRTDVRPNLSFLQRVYEDQFFGDFSLWLEQPSKTLIIDNMSAASRFLDLIEFVAGYFNRIVILSSSDMFYSFFIDESRLSDYIPFKIMPLTLGQQETLIRKRLLLTESDRIITDTFVDQVEDQVNSVIISDKIFPRYPFYVLSILQTYEAYMPTNMAITSYGHCYHVLIVASLMNAGISKTDDDINAAFNFAEQLAFAIYENRRSLTTGDFDFAEFLVNYNDHYVIKQSIVNRLKHSTLGIIRDEGVFRTEFMYYFFLGRFLASHADRDDILAEMSEFSHIEANYLTILFTIHHTNDQTIIDDILLRTMCTLDSVDPATLEKSETQWFGNLLAALPDNVLSANSVEVERREHRDALGSSNNSLRDKYEDDKSTELNDPVNDMYRILKNNKIMGQILRNKYGTLERRKIEDIIEIIADSGLRLVKFMLVSEEEIAALAKHIKDQHPSWDLNRIKSHLHYLSFLWTMINIEEVVNAVNVPEIRQSVDNVVERKRTPAYDLVGYFNQIDNTEGLSLKERDRLSSLLREHDDLFVQRVLSLRTQFYMNTHSSSERIEQSICSLLGLKYTKRMLGGR